MVDVHDKATRSYNMSRIKGKDTKPELIVRRYLHARGLRFRLHNKKLPGKPDLVFSKYKTVVFLHGCFWHKHDGCRYFVVPKTRTEWWLKKIDRNVEKDKENEKALRILGWKVLIIWECDLKKEKRKPILNKLYNDITC